MECSHLRRRAVVALPSWTADLARKFRGPTDDAGFMELAIALSRENVARGAGGPFGAVVVERDTGRIVSVGVNRVVPLRNSSLHAEVVALMLAQAAIGSYTLDDPGIPPHTLYTSCDPCAMCLGAIWWSGLRRVVCGATKEDALAAGFDEGPVFADSYRYLEDRGVEFVHGLQREAAREVLMSYVEGDGKVYNG